MADPLSLQHVSAARPIVHIRPIVNCHARVTPDPLFFLFFSWKTEGVETKKEGVETKKPPPPK